MKDWKQLKRHRLSADYGDISADKMKDMVDGLRRLGVLGDRKVTLFEGQILDGYQFAQACKQAGVEPTFQELPPEVEPEDWVEIMNDRRRHEPFETTCQRAAERRSRVCHARAGGQSIRTIAKEEGVSKATIQADLEKATVQGGTVEPPDGKVIGQDGKKRPARRETVTVLCDRCKKVGPARDCPQCRELAKQKEADKKDRKTGKRTVKGPESIKDSLGAEVPARCRDAFADTGLRDMIAEMEGVEVMLTAQRWSDTATKLKDHYAFILSGKVKEHVFDALGSLQCARESLAAGLPYAVCPKCNGERADGKTCRFCRGGGFVPEHAYKEMVK